jgi:hypothetical protein
MVGPPDVLGRKRCCESLRRSDASRLCILPISPVRPLVLAALRQKMLALARDKADGAHPYFVPPAHTHRAREILGAGKLLAPAQAVILETDPAQARAA